MATTRERAKNRVETLRLKTAPGKIKPKPVVKPTGMELALREMAEGIKALVAKNTDVTVNVPEQKRMDPAPVNVNVPEQVKPSIHINVPEQKQPPAPIINVKVPQQQPPNITLESPEIVFPEQQVAKEWQFTIHRLDNGLINSITAKRTG